jgi:hypothetical protein
MSYVVTRGAQMDEISQITGRKNAIEKVNYSHDAMIDLILANPKITQNELAATFGYSVGWTSRVIGSDAFQARLAERKVEVVDPEIKQNFEQRLQGLGLQSLDVIQRKLDATQNPDLAVKALELSTKALGFGARAQNIAQQNNFVVALPPKMVNEQEWAAHAKATVSPSIPASIQEIPSVVDVTPKVKEQA